MNGLHKLQRFVAPTLFAGIVAAIVSGWQNTGFEPQARAEPRRGTPQEPDQHFKSGGQKSEAVLQEILSVLKRMDERMERMERSVEQIAGGARSPTSRSVGGAPTGLPATAPPISVRSNR